MNGYRMWNQTKTENYFNMHTKMIKCNFEIWNVRFDIHLQKVYPHCDLVPLILCDLVFSFQQSSWHNYWLCLADFPMNSWYVPSAIYTVICLIWYLRYFISLSSRFQSLNHYDLIGIYHKCVLTILSDISCINKTLALWFIASWHLPVISTISFFRWVHYVLVASIKPNGQF
jgi:hypothetical protein